MINASELRLGNWVDRTAGKMPVSWISEEGAWFDDGDCVAYKYLEPIPLTPDTLEKAGFVKVQVIKRTNQMFNFETVTHEYEFGDWLEPSLFEVSITTDTNSEKATINTKHKSDIKYVHQLQNLFFALTGEELPIQLTT